MKLKSKWEFGVAWASRHGLMKGMGYTDDELDKPRIAVVNSWNEYNPGHIHLNNIAARVKHGIIEAGGLPIEVSTSAMCDVMSMIDPKYIELPSRNMVADQVEMNVGGNMLDGMVLISTCDSIVPGQLMGAARLDIPTIMVTGGYMPMGKYRGEDVDFIRVLDRVGEVQQGDMPRKEFDELMSCAHTPCGACGIIGTANTMCMLAEALGMSLPGNSSISAVSRELPTMAYQAGKQIMELLKNGITARDIITEKSVKNAIRVGLAVGGSPNMLPHVPAIAQEAGLDKNWWKEFDIASNEIPLLTAITPNGPNHMYHFDYAGGLTPVIKNLLPKLNGDCLTVTGKTISENVKNAQVYDSEIIRDLNNPIQENGTIAVLYGNIAPEGAILKAAATPKNLFKFSGKAKVFDSLDESLIALRNGKIEEGDAVVIRYLGPKARFGITAYPFLEELKGMSKKLFNTCAMISDGRLSGAITGLSIGYVSPEAALGGALAIVKNGDIIEIDINKRQMNLKVTEEEIKNRFKEWNWEFKEEEYPRYLNLFRNNVSSAARGVIWEK